MIVGSRGDWTVLESMITGTTRAVTGFRTHKAARDWLRAVTRLYRAGHVGTGYWYMPRDDARDAQLDRETLIPT